MLAQLLVQTALLLSSSLLLAASNAYAQTDPNGTTSQGDQKPAEEKQGREYSSFEETCEQTEGLRGKEANPVPKAPISNLDVQQQNQTTATTTETAAVAAENPASGTSGLMLLAGMGAITAAAIVVATWYFRKRAKEGSS